MGGMAGAGALGRLPPRSGYAPPPHRALRPSQAYPNAFLGHSTVLTAGAKGPVRHFADGDILQQHPPLAAFPSTPQTPLTVPPPAGPSLLPTKPQPAALQPTSPLCRALPPNPQNLYSKPWPLPSLHSQPSSQKPPLTSLRSTHPSTHPTTTDSPFSHRTSTHGLRSETSALGARHPTSPRFKSFPPTKAPTHSASSHEAPTCGPFPHPPSPTNRPWCPQT